MRTSVLLFCAILKLSFSVPVEDASAASNTFLQSKTVTKNSQPILSESIEVAALGRVADLGDLYDARRDQFVQISLYTTDISEDSIHTTDNAYASIDFVKSEKLSDKMETLGVQAQLSISVLAGIVDAHGAGSYLGEDKSSSKSAKTSLTYKIRTIREDLKIFSKSSRSLMDTFLVDNIDATHVVVGIDWGADVVLSVEESNTDSSNAKEIQAELDAQIKVIAVQVSGSAEVNLNSSDIESSSSFSLHLHGDIIPNAVPQTIVEAIEFIRSIPDLIKSENNGKGKIMNYILMPLATVQKVFQSESNKTGVVKEIEQGLIDQFMRIFQEMKDSELLLNDAYTSFNTWSLMIPENDFTELSEVKSKFDSFTNDLRIRFADSVVQFRSGMLNEEALYELIKTYESSNWTAASINVFLDKFKATMHKTELLNLLQNHNALFIDRRTDSYKILADNYDHEIRIISADLSIDISSPYVFNMIQLLEIESGKGDEAISYYIQDDADVSVPEVNAYLQGNIINSFSVLKKEYILLTDSTSGVIIVDANSLEKIVAYNLPEITWTTVAVVSSMIYNINVKNGTITSTAIENFMTGPDAIKWTQVGSFPPEIDNIRNSAVANQTDIYFTTYYGYLYKYDTIYRTVTQCGKILSAGPYYYASLIILNNVLFIHSYTAFYSYDAIAVNEIKVPQVRHNCGIFRFNDKVCRVGGNHTDVYPDPVDCYDPEYKTWNVTTHINEARHQPGIAGTESKTYIFGGHFVFVNTTAFWISSVEVFDRQTKVFSYALSPYTTTPDHPQAVIFNLYTVLK